MGQSCPPTHCNSRIWGRPGTLVGFSRTSVCLCPRCTPRRGTSRSSWPAECCEMLSPAGNWSGLETESRVPNSIWQATWRLKGLHHCLKWPLKFCSLFALPVQRYNYITLLQFCYICTRVCLMYLSLVHGGLHTPGRQRHVQRPDRHLQTVLHLDRQRPRLPLTVAPAAALLPLPPGAGVPSTAPRLIAVVLLGCLCQLLLQSLLCCCSA